MKESITNKILKGNIPQHIAIIMDGNGRWARARALPRIAGHKEGINSVIDRSNAFVDAGADSIFPEAITKLEDYHEISKNVNAPI